MLDHYHTTIDLVDAIDCTYELSNTPSNLVIVFYYQIN